MPPIQTHRQIVTGFGPSETSRRLLTAFAARRAAMATVTDHHLEGRVGSQVSLRLKGGWLCKPEDFPIVAAVSVTPDGSGSVVRITVADDLGFGLKAGMTKKYKNAIDAFADHLAEALDAPPAAPTPCACGHPASTSASFCGQCGARLTTASTS